MRLYDFIIVVIDGFEKFYINKNLNMIKTFLTTGKMTFRLRLLKFLVIYAEDLVKKNSDEFRNGIKSSK